MLDLTDSLSSVKALLSRKKSHRTHSMIYELKQMCSDLLWNGVEVEIMWILSHLELEGNELVLSVNFQDLVRSILQREWHGKWDAANTERFTHSILPRFCLRPWFEGQREDRKVVSTVPRIMSQLSRFRIVESRPEFESSEK
jgi:hypothetical protein